MLIDIERRRVQTHESATIEPGNANKDARTLGKDALQKLLCEAVEKAMSIFNERSRKAIYRYLEKNHGFSLDNLPDGIDRLDHGLRDLLGNSTAELLEGLALRQLNQNLGQGLFENAGKKTLTEFAKDLERIMSEKEE
ncbi:hypothetical protein MUP77_01065 [Candidatus Bathyarchaeota archaeon]|nr:hypothetical protein [Candidatus Bathyarchaeota archaeon]